MQSLLLAECCVEDRDASGIHFSNSVFERAQRHRGNNQLREPTFQTNQSTLTDVERSDLYGLQGGKARCKLRFHLLDFLGFTRSARSAHLALTKVSETTRKF